jgi:FKBP-type peptidyl-prolyl cis-trans isomerase (trigger factor)
LDEYLASINKTEEELREELRPAALERVTRSLVLGKISEQEKIKVRDSEIDSEIEEMIKGATEDKKDEFKKLLNTPQSRESIEQLLVSRKNIQQLVDIARGSKEKQKKEGAK